MTEEITQEINGECELYFEISNTSVHAGELAESLLCLSDDDQAYRIYDIRRKMNRIAVNARHIVFDFSATVIKPFTATSASNACTKIIANSVKPILSYTISSALVSSKAFEFGEPTSAWNLMRNMVSVYGGEWQYGTYNPSNYWVGYAILKDRLGKDTGMVISYGANITDFELTDNTAQYFDSLQPFYQADGKSIVYGTIIQINAKKSIYNRVRAMNFKDYFDHEPTTAELDTVATAYVAAHQDPGVERSISVKFITNRENQLQQLELGDSVIVNNAIYGYRGELRVVKTVRDMITGLYKSIELGSIKPELSDTLAASDAQIAELDNNRLSAAPVLLASSSANSVTQLDMTPGFVNENFHTFVLVCRNSIRQLISVSLPRVCVPTTTDSRFNDDTNFTDYAHWARYGSGAAASFKIDLVNWKCKILVDGPYIGEIYGVR